MEYKEEEILIAIDKARNEINRRTEKTNRYIRGYNDCYVFLVLYEGFLRGENSLYEKLPASYDYKDHKEFFKKFAESGHTSLDDFAKVMMFEPVTTRVPKTGDVAYEEKYGIGSAMIAENGYWVSPREDKSGVRKHRKLLFKELRPILLARPVYI